MTRILSEVRTDFVGKDPEYNQFISDTSQYQWFENDLACVPENYLEVTDLTFYYPKKLQDNVNVKKTENNELDAVAMLYSDESVNHYPSWPGSNTDYYDVTAG